MTKFFLFLCDRLAAIGKPLGWDYYTASVYICIHLWPLLCVAMSLVMLAVSISTASALWIGLCSLYAALNIFGYWVVVRHYYPGSIIGIFERCRDDLIAIADEWHTSYAVVNLVVYLALFAAIMSFDVLLILLML